MTDQLQELLARARNTQQTEADREAQRQSFAYGNAALANADVTRETVRLASEQLAKEQRDG
jgi:hypothetical protein